MRYLLPLALLTALVTPALAQDWKIADNPIVTRWAKDVRPDNAWPEYPRPQLVRKEWQNLNGLWNLRIGDATPRKILVPYPVESALSGVGEMVSPTTVLHYKRSFNIPAGWDKRNVLLHFGAVDWDAKVSVNGKQLAEHRGGYDPFTVDITPALNGAGEQSIEVDVTDPTDTGFAPRGKQVQKPGGIFYRPSSGIWQTVWIEPVSAMHLTDIKITPDVDHDSVRVKPTWDGTASSTLLVVYDNGKEIARGVSHKGEEVSIRIPKPKLWSPDSPFLYGLTASLLAGGPVDTVESYFGMRKISLGRDKGITKTFLNNKPIFQFGPLDQGFWPDGLYTPPNEAAMKSDLDFLKDIGCNTLRKHVKVEPDRYYYLCDKMGLLVWQDMPSGFPTVPGQNAKRNPADAQQHELELKRMIDALKNHPCIVTWVVFNEGWGQYDTERITKWTQAYDPSRLANNASGWTDKNVGDMIDMHNYPGPGMPKPEAKRASVLGEFGGLGLPVEGHMWQSKGWGYQSYKTHEELTNALLTLLANLRPLVGSGLSAAIYTQTTDVETELNGFMTYDREVVKFDRDKVRTAINKLYGPPPVVRTIVPTSESKGAPWKYTFLAPSKDWFASNFNEMGWFTGPGGFGTKETPGAIVRTDWATPDIWIRRTFNISPGIKWHNPALMVHHDEDAEIYIDGKLVITLPDYVSNYTIVPLPALANLAPGKHTLAVHCHQTDGGQYIDVGISDIEGD